MYHYIFVWSDPQYEGRSEGNLIRTQKCKSDADAFGKALYWLQQYKNVKVEIVQVEEPWPDEIVGGE